MDSIKTHEKMICSTRDTAFVVPSTLIKFENLVPTLPTIRGKILSPSPSPSPTRISGRVGPKMSIITFGSGRAGPGFSLADFF